MYEQSDKKKITCRKENVGHNDPFPFQICMPKIGATLGPGLWYFGVKFRGHDYANFTLALINQTACNHINEYRASAHARAASWFWPFWGRCMVLLCSLQVGTSVSKRIWVMRILSVVSEFLVLETQSNLSSPVGHSLAGSQPPWKVRMVPNRELDRW